MDLKKRWMLLGIRLAKLLPFLHRAKMAVGDSMVLSCTLTMPGRPDGTQWPDGRLPLLVMFRAPKGMAGGELLVAEPTSGGGKPVRTAYRNLELEPMPLFGGAAYVFVTDNYDERLWYIVRCEDGDRTVEADPVLSKIDVGPSGFDMAFARSDGALPTSFGWQEAPNPDHWIHFLVISQGDELYTGIYTRNTRWLYGEFGDLPYYIHDPMKTKPLKAGEEYGLMYHAVDNDGWVSMSCMRSFHAGSADS
ncbi:MAG: hypothetical protein IH945_09295 [Armatimonadetes bacterium]|nr:hypothetical protein [Armatimonadota bacterium]